MFTPLSGSRRIEWTGHDVRTDARAKPDSSLAAISTAPTEKKPQLLDRKTS
jgi:hypothetical protein